MKLILAISLLFFVTLGHAERVERVKGTSFIIGKDSRVRYKPRTKKKFYNREGRYTVLGYIRRCSERKCIVKMLKRRKEFHLKRGKFLFAVKALQDAPLESDQAFGEESSEVAEEQPEERSEEVVEEQPEEVEEEQPEEQPEEQEEALEESYPNEDNYSEFDSDSSSDSSSEEASSDHDAEEESNSGKKGEPRFNIKAGLGGQNVSSLFIESDYIRGKWSFGLALSTRLRGRSDIELSALGIMGKANYYLNDFKENGFVISGSLGVLSLTYDVVGVERVSQFQVSETIPYLSGDISYKYWMGGGRYYLSGGVGAAYIGYGENFSDPQSGLTFSNPYLNFDIILELAFGMAF